MSGRQFTSCLLLVRIHMDAQRRNSPTAAVAARTASNNQAAGDIKKSQNSDGCLGETHADARQRLRYAHMSDSVTR